MSFLRGMTDLRVEVNARGTSRSCYVFRLSMRAGFCLDHGLLWPAESARTPAPTARPESEIEAAVTRRRPTPS